MMNTTPWFNSSTTFFALARPSPFVISTRTVVVWCAFGGLRFRFLVWVLGLVRWRGVRLGAGFAPNHGLLNRHRQKLLIGHSQLGQFFGHAAKHRPGRVRLRGALFRFGCRPGCARLRRCLREVRQAKAIRPYGTGAAAEVLRRSVEPVPKQNRSRDRLQHDTRHRCQHPHFLQNSHDERRGRGLGQALTEEPHGVSRHVPSKVPGDRVEDLAQAKVLESIHHIRRQRYSKIIQSSGGEEMPAF